MNILLFAVVWLSFSAIVGIVIGLTVKLTDQTVCMCCGRVIDGPGICASCAEVAEEVPEVVQVRQVLPEYTVINPGDLD